MSGAHPQRAASLCASLSRALADEIERLQRQKPLIAAPVHRVIAELAPGLAIVACHDGAYGLINDRCGSGERSDPPALGVADTFVPAFIPLTDFQAGCLLSRAGERA